MQINRYFEILYLLLDRKKMTAQELADHFEVSVRTIYRDLDALSQAGIPIYADRGRGGGISLWDTFILNKTILSKPEREELMALLEGMKTTGFSDQTQVGSKIAALLGGQSQRWIEADFTQWSDAENQRGRFDQLRSAILRHHRIRFDYYSLKGEKTQRTAEPLRLVFRAQAWYLYAWCLLRQEARFFKIVRMRSLEFLDETFMPRSVPEVLSTVMASEELRTRVRVRVKEEGLYRLLDDFGELDMEFQDGYYWVTLSCPGTDWVVSYLLSQGDNIEVIEPEAVRSQIADTVRKLHELYQ